MRVVLLFCSIASVFHLNKLIKSHWEEIKTA